MIKLTFLFFLVAIFHAKSQMILNQKGQAFSDAPFFKSEFIASNNIKSFEGKISYKNSGDIIRETKDVMRFEFDEKGRLKRILETQKQHADTLFSYFEYDENDNLTCFRKSQSGGLSAFYYVYQDNDLIKMEQRKDIMDAQGNLQKSILVNVEKYEYKTVENTRIKVFLNSYDLPYMEEFETKNELGYRTSIIQKLKMADASQTVRFGYDQKGLMNEMSTYYNKSENAQKRRTFKYDDFGNVIERKEYQGEVCKEDFQIIYDPKTDYLSSIIVLNTKDDQMKIVRFTEYAFY